MKKIMLGDVVKKLGELPSVMLGVIFDLLEKLCSEEGEEWFKALKRFLRKQTCWGTDWQNFFGHLWVMDCNFNDHSYPLEPETDGVVRTYRLGEKVTVLEARRRFKEMGYSLPGSRAVGKYIQANRLRQVLSPIVALGMRWQRSSANALVPIFAYVNKEEIKRDATQATPEELSAAGLKDTSQIEGRFVTLISEDEEISPNCDFLVFCKPGEEEEEKVTVTNVH